VSLVLLLGGARSGKSSLAVELARRSGGAVTFVATGEAVDEEMAERIRRHRAERPSGWTTVEEPCDLGGALSLVADHHAVVVDCLSLWVANLLERGDSDAEVEEEAREIAGLARARTALTVAVTNEVGLGVVPATPLGRRYRDVLGRTNAEWAAAADQVALVVAGRVLRLDPAEELPGWIA
jgi:adenosylcobinamide kinase / adenosylcobinamide-phosphate guanylyltransferase